LKNEERAFRQVSPRRVSIYQNFFIEDKSEIARIDPTARSYVLFNLKPKC